VLGIAQSDGEVAATQASSTAPVSASSPDGRSSATLQALVPVLASLTFNSDCLKSPSEPRLAGAEEASMTILSKTGDCPGGPASRTSISLWRQSCRLASDSALGEGEKMVTLAPSHAGAGDHQAVAAVIAWAGKTRNGDPARCPARLGVLGYGQPGVLHEYFGSRPILAACCSMARISST